MNNKVVYLHYKKGTNEVFYIGIGNIDRAYNKRSRSSFWKSLVDKYGFDVEVVCENISFKEACILETILIEIYGRRDLGNGSLVNLTSGGDGAPNVIKTMETRKKTSNTLKGKSKTSTHSSNISKGRKGIKFSKEQLKNMSLCQKGKKATKETKDKMSKAIVGRIHVNNGVLSKMVYPNDIPNGFVKGRLKR
tara:strand:- start:45 stop:620 length:576 start_codon:yes stop_codon:yes gene_type:complete